MNIAPVLVAIAIAFAASIWLRPKQSWSYLRDRVPDQEYWKQFYVMDQMPIVESALKLISEAFLLRPDDIYRLRYDDKLIEIYRAAYPSKQTPDALEFEILSKSLMERYRVPQSVMQQYKDPTVRNVVQWCLQYGGA